MPECTSWPPQISTSAIEELFMGDGRAVLLLEKASSSGTMRVMPREKRTKGAGALVSATKRRNADLR